MIIKSLSRKEPSFGQLTNYILDPEGARLSVLHNLPVGSHTPEQIVSAFEKEHAQLPRRANGNALFHELLSLEPNTDVPVSQQAKALRTIAARYLELRAPLQLGIGVVHTDTAHIHIHLMISSNAIHSRRRISLSKSAFAVVQHDIEKYRLTHFPELGNRRMFDQDRARMKRTVREQTGSTRSGQPSHKEELAIALAGILQHSKQREAMNTSLAKLGLTLYQRGRSVGVQTTGGRRYRLSTLGLAEDYTEAVTRFELYESRMTELDKSQSQRSKELEQER